MATGNKALVGTGLVTAIASSLCCITPVLAIISGTSGAASTFSWFEPARPYLVGFTVLVLAFAWYQKLKPRKKEEMACDCEEDEKPSFWQSKKFLLIVTVFAGVMMAFPLYGHIFYPDNSKEVVVVDKDNVETVEFIIDGMTCETCSETIVYAVNELEGIVKVKSSYEDGLARVEFDKTKVSVEEIEDAINETGYSVVDFKMLND